MFFPVKRSLALLLAVAIAPVFACEEPFGTAEDAGRRDGAVDGAIGCGAGCDNQTYCNAEALCVPRLRDGVGCSSNAACASGACVGSVGSQTCCATQCASGVACVQAYPDSDNDGFGDRAKTNAPSFRCANEVAGVQKAGDAGADADADADARPDASTSARLAYTTDKSDCDDSDARAFPGQTQYYTIAAKGGGFDFDCDTKEAPLYRENLINDLRCGVCVCAAGSESDLCYMNPPAGGLEGAVFRGPPPKPGGKQQACECGLSDIDRTFFSRGVGPICGEAPDRLIRCDRQVVLPQTNCGVQSSNSQTARMPCR